MFLITKLYSRKKQKTFNEGGFIMDIIISMLVIFCALIFSIYNGIFVGYPLLLGFFIFTYIS